MVVIHSFLFFYFLQEWAIAEQKDVEEKQKHGKNSTSDADFVTLNADDALAKLAKHQQPLEIPVIIVPLGDLLSEFHLGFPNLPSLDLVEL